jgi:DNA primase
MLNSTPPTGNDTDIVLLISAYVNLQPSRKTWRGPCPFHADKADSLMVSPEKQTYKCFGCGAEGGIAEFRLAVG